MMGEINGEALCSSLLREQPVREQSRLHKLLGISCSSSSSSQSLSFDAAGSSELDELDEEDVWAADEGGLRYGVESESTIQKPGIVERNGSALCGIGDIVMLEQSSGTDPSHLKAASEARGITSSMGMNRFPAFSSILSSQLNREKAPTGRRLNREAIARRIPMACRMIPQGMRSERPVRRPMHQSAPVNIPDWSKILNLEKPRKVWLDVSDDDHEDEEERLPPHELLAQHYARSQMTSSSVFEGAGRTLKGRDMSRVRDAVLTQTGFFG